MKLDNVSAELLLFVFAGLDLTHPRPITALSVPLPMLMSADLTAACPSVCSFRHGC